MRKFIIVISLFIIIVSAVFIYYHNRDNSIRKEILTSLEDRYNAKFEYVGKKGYANDGTTYYQFCPKDNRSLIIDTYIDNTSFVPFDLSSEPQIIDYFDLAISKYYTNRKCGGTIDITNNSIDDKAQLVYDLLKEVNKQLEFYYKNGYLGTCSIWLKVVYGNYSDNMAFDELDIEVIKEQLIEFTQTIINED